MKAIDAEKTYTHLLKIGDVKNVRVNSTNKVQVYQFMLENKEPTQIVPTIITGTVKISLSFGENKEQTIREQEDSSVIWIRDEFLKTEVNYYLTIECMSDKAELTIAI